MKKMFILLYFLVFISSFAGKLVRLENNEKIILKDNGEWDLLNKMKNNNVIIEDEDIKGKYFGESNRGYAHGYGKSLGKDIYEGYFFKGIIHGYGKYVWRNSKNETDIYEGEFYYGRADGKGEIKFSNGNSYQGDWKKGKIEGNGKLVFKEGVSYEGEFKDDEPNGHGVIIFENGETYKGEFVNGFPKHKDEYESFLLNNSNDGLRLKNKYEEALKDIKISQNHLIELNNEFAKQYYQLLKNDMIDRDTAEYNILVLILTNQFIEKNHDIYNSFTKLKIENENLR